MLSCISTDRLKRVKNGNALHYDLAMAMTSVGHRKFSVHYNLTGPPSYVPYGVDQTVIIWCMTIIEVGLNFRCNSIFHASNHLQPQGV